MAEYGLTEAQEKLRQAARAFAAREVKPFAARWDREGHFPMEAMRAAAAEGLLGVIIPKRHGGLGLDNMALCLIGEEIQAACASTGVTWSVHNSLTASPIIHFGTEAQMARYFPAMARGERIGAYALSEPEHGSDAAALECRARMDGGDYVLDGTKAWITNGSYAGLYVVFATIEKKLRAKGITAFLVEREMAGFSVGKKEQKLGIRASDTVQIHLDSVRVPAANRLGDEGQGFKIAMHTFDGGRIGIATQAVGIGRAALECALDDAVRTGRIEDQLVQHRLSDVAMEVDAARLLTWRAATLKDRGLPHSKEASMAKLFASEAANRAARAAVEVLGAEGYTAEHAAERLYRDAKITEIYEGTSEIQRLVIARALGK